MLFLCHESAATLTAAIESCLLAHDSWRIAADTYSHGDAYDGKANQEAHTDTYGQAYWTAYSRAYRGAYI